MIFRSPSHSPQFLFSICLFCPLLHEIEPMYRDLNIISLISLLVAVSCKKSLEPAKKNQELLRSNRENEYGPNFGSGQSIPLHIFLLDRVKKVSCSEGHFLKAFFLSSENFRRRGIQRFIHVSRTFFLHFYTLRSIGKIRSYSILENAILFRS